MSKTTTLQFYRGVAASLPTLADGEPAWTTDTHALYVGQGGTNYAVGGGGGGGGFTPAGCRVKRTSGTASLASAAWTAVLFDAESYDSDAFHSTGSNTSRITIPSGKAGKYLLGGSAAFAAGISGTGSRRARIRRGGSLVVALSDVEPGSASLEVQLTALTVYDCAVSDYFEFEVWHDSGVVMDLANGIDYTPVFWAHLIG